MLSSFFSLMEIMFPLFRAIHDDGDPFSFFPPWRTGWLLPFFFFSGLEDSLFLFFGASESGYLLFFFSDTSIFLFLSLFSEETSLSCIFFYHLPSSCRAESRSVLLSSLLSSDVAAFTLLPLSSPE